MKKKSLAPIAFLAIFALMLLLSGAAEAQTAVVIAEESVSFDVKRSVYTPTKDNEFTFANIYESNDGKTLKIIVNKYDGGSDTYACKIIKRRKNSREIYCEVIGNGKKILIEQNSTTLLINYEFNEQANRYYSAIQFSKLVSRNIG